MDALLYRPEDGAQLIAVSRARFFELLASGDIESVKIGRSRRVTRTALEDYVARLSAAQGPPGEVPTQVGTAA